MSRDGSEGRKAGPSCVYTALVKENPAFSMGDVTLVQFEAMVTDLRTLRGQIEDSRTQLTQLVNQSNDKLAAISTVTTRARSGFRAFFGPDSRAGGWDTRQ